MYNPSALLCVSSCLIGKIFTCITWVWNYLSQALPSPRSKLQVSIKGHNRKSHMLDCGLWFWWARYREEGGTHTHGSMPQACSPSSCLMQTWTPLQTVVSKICPECKQGRRSNPQTKSHPSVAWSHSSNAPTGAWPYLEVSPALANANTLVPSVPELHMELKSESSWCISFYTELFLIFSKILHVTQPNGKGDCGSDYRGNICRN